MNWNYIIQVEINGKPAYYVALGLFTSKKEEATPILRAHVQKICDQLKAARFAPIATRIDSETIATN